MSYAYLDVYKMLHVVDDEATAKKYASGKVVATDLPHNAGYFVDGNGRHVRVDVDDKSFRVGKQHISEKEFVAQFPAINSVIQKLV